MSEEVNRLIGEIRSRQFKINTIDDEVTDLEADYERLGELIDRKEDERNEIQAEIDDLTADLIAAAKGFHED